MSKSHLFITPYAPYRDGIASYAVQEVRARRKSGEEIEVLSPRPSAAHHHLALGGPRGTAALLKRAKGHSRYTVQFYQELAYGKCRNRIERYLVWAIWRMIAGRVDLELRVHEVTYSVFQKSRVEKALFRSVLRAADTVAVHSKQEADQLAEVMGLDAVNIDIVEHGQYFSKVSSMSKSQARDELGLDRDKFVFLSIGFLQEHKGFERGIQVIERLKPEGAELHVVGSGRVDAKEIVEYLVEFRRTVNQADFAHLHEGYLSDRDFDLWIIAADCLVLPYKEIWSSGVLERAKLYQTQAIVSNTGGLSYQTDLSTRVVSSDIELEAEMRKVVEQWASTQRISPVMSKASAKGSINTGEDLVNSLAATSQTVASDRGSSTGALSRIGRVTRPDASSPSRLKRKLKSVVLRFINWQVEPVASHVDRFQGATEETVAHLEARISSLEQQLAQTRSTTEGDS